MFSEALTCTQTRFRASARVPVVIPSNSLPLSTAGLLPQQNWWRSCGLGNQGKVPGWTGSPARSQDAGDREEVAFKRCAERRQMACLRCEGTRSRFVLEWKNADSTCCGNGEPSPGVASDLGAGGKSAFRQSTRRKSRFNGSGWWSWGAGTLTERTCWRWCVVLAQNGTSRNWFDL